MARRNPSRGRWLAIGAVALYLDYSKTLVTDGTSRLLFEPASSPNLYDRIDVRFDGENLNMTERRAVLHVASRAPGDRGSARRHEESL